MPIVGTPSSASEPLTTAEVKTHLRIDFTDDDAYLSALITAARQYAEVTQGRAIVSATYVEKYDAFPWMIYVPSPPLISVTSIAYLDTAGDSQTLSSSLYTVDTSSMVGRITPAYGYTWPSTQDVINAVTLTYVAGYAGASDVPQTTKQAMLMLISHWYEHRSAVADVQMMPVPMAVQTLLGFERVVEFH